MEIRIIGDPKEIAALAAELQERRKGPILIREPYSSNYKIVWDKEPSGPADAK